MKNIFFILLLSIAFGAKAQQTIEIQVKDSITGESLPGVAAVLAGTTIGISTNSKGYASIQVPNGKQRLVFSLVGYRKKQVTFSVPGSNENLIVLLAPAEQEMEEVIVSATRTNSRIEDLPMKVEVLGQEDLEEENSIKPGNIASLLGDVSSVQIQQTSVATGASNVKIQGLDGKYTQILRDGLPLYEGFSGSLSILQIPPLDLKQIELIKGSASTLYGGGAIGGIINLVSREPSDSAEGSITLNQSTLRETNINGFYSQRKGKWGYTFFAGNTHQQAVDVNKDGFSDVPAIDYTLLHPRVFYYFSPNTTANLGFSTLFENRKGGDMQVINFKPDSLHQYFEANKTNRQTIDGQFRTKISANQELTIKSTATVYSRELSTTGFLFNGKQISSFTELSDVLKAGKHIVVAGLNYITDRFSKDHSDFTYLGRFHSRTVGAFVQDNWQVNSKWTLETGLRLDYHSQQKVFVLPRAAVLYKATSKLSFRLNGGLGYKTPNVFAQDMPIQYLLPISNDVKAEKSRGLNIDASFKHYIGKLSILLNQSFFYTHIDNPILPQTLTTGYTAFANDRKALQTKGLESYVRIGFEDLEIYLGYTYTDAQKEGMAALLVPKHKVATTIAYTIPNKWRIGIESAYTSTQLVTAERQVQGYWFTAAMIERKFKNISLVLNGENLFDFRQTRVENIVIPPNSNPTFRPLWAPIDGRVINLAVRIKF